MNKIGITFFAFLFFSGLTPHVLASDGHEHKHSANAYENERGQKHENESDHHEAGDHEEEGATQIDNSVAEQVGIKTVRAGAQLLSQTISCFGRLALGPEQTSHVRARFPGVISSVKVTIGDEVKTGDLLAVVESNESLKKYELRSPISGTVTQRHANTGEMTQEQVLFSIVNLDALWVELRVFPAQQSALAVNQLVDVAVGEAYYQTVISHLIPTENGEPYLIARAKLQGPVTAMYPGLMVEGRVVVNQFTADVAVKNSALQSMHNQMGVFVKNNNHYKFVPLVLGRTDHQFTEVLSGINANAEYVWQNSYMVKADIQKSEAAHEH